ncbi:MAG: hypothetical protein WC956_07110 [bacterium]
MKKHARRLIQIIVIVAVLAALAFFLRDASDIFRAPSYDAAAPTSVKFMKLSRWMPAGSEFDFTVDVPRALANPMLKERLLELIHGKEGVAAELVAALMAHQDAVGLITLVGTLGNKDEQPRFAILAQGKFDQGIILPAIRAAMAAGRSGLTSEDLGWATLFAESDEREPFGFIILDKQHIAVGNRDALVTFYSQRPSPVESIGRLSDAVIFGHAVIGPRLKGLVPQTIQLPESVDFGSADGQTIEAALNLTDQAQAMSMRMFLEGVRSLIMLEQEHNLPLVDILKGISISGNENKVFISSGLLPLADLWGALPESEEEGNEPAPAHVQQAPVGKP